MSIFREFNINMIPGKPPLIIHVSQYESDFVYTFNLVSGKSVLAIPDTAIAVIRGTKRDGNGFSKEASLDTENNKVVVIGEVQMTACAGKNVFELAIINDEKTICTANFFLDVERAPLDSDTIQSETVLHDLTAIIEGAKIAAQAAETAQEVQETVIGILESGAEEAVDNWLEEHPEATTTVQDGAITETKLAPALKLKVIKDYVTPEMYGAKGDGQTDDSAALREAFTKGNVCLKRGAIYKCSNVDIVSNSVIVGNGATIDSGNASGFIIKKTVHDVLITDINFESVFTVGDTETPSNYCIGIQASNTTEEYEAYNIEVSHCKFTCGVFGIVGTSVKNLYIHDCEFYGGVFRPEDSAGGYAILTQSCINVTIERCYFKLGKYSRHDIYVSVSQSKTDNIESKNYKISNCYSDKSLITEHENDAFYSPNILSVVVRSVYNLIVENYRLYNGTGLIAVNGEDGLVVNAIFKNCINDTPRFKASSTMPSEARHAYNAHCQSGSSVTFENCELYSNITSFLQYSVDGGLIEICNTTINSYIDVGDCEFLHLHDLFVKGAFLRFTGNGVLHGKFYSLESDGSYNFGTATNVSNGAYIDINAYDDDLLGPWSVNSSGALTFVKNKLHVVATCAVENNDHGLIITLNYTKRPSAITRAMSLADGCVIEANVTTSNINDNQVRFRKFKLADGTAAANRACRFYLC